MVRKKKRSRTLKGFGHAIGRVPVLAMTAFRHGALPAGVETLRTLKREGTEDLHWKALGDSLVRFFRHSGPVLTKIGQILATRNDILPETVCVRLESLYSRQPAMSDRELSQILKKAYPRGLPFRDHEKKPLAVGSVGQVHRATLKDGSRVVVKVIRPGARKSIERDLAVAFALVKAYPMARSTQLMVERVLEDLETAFLSELELKQEAASIEEFRKRFRSNPRVCVPKCYREHSSDHVLVIEELRGEPLSAFRERAKTDPQAAKKIAGLALGEILSQIFEHGRFHADPHAGNLLVLEDGRLGLIDFGLTGEFTRENRRQIAKAVKALLARDADGLIRALLGFGTVPSDFDSDAFKEDVKRVVVDRKTALGMGLDKLVNELFRTAYRHRVYVPQATTLLIKTLVTVEGVARSLDPEINLVSVAVPVILKSLTPKWLRFIYPRA